MCYFLSISVDPDPRYSIPPSYPRLFFQSILFCIRQRLRHLYLPCQVNSRLFSLPYLQLLPLINICWLTQVQSQPHFNILGNCILQISIVSNPASALYASAKVFYHLLLRLCHGILFAIRLSTWYWNHIIYRNMWGVTTQDSVYKSNTYWTTDLKKNPETRGISPSLISTLDILCHTVRAFTIFWNTVGQSTSSTDSTLPRYLKYVTISRGSP